MDGPRDLTWTVYKSEGLWNQKVDGKVKTGRPKGTRLDRPKGWNRSPKRLKKNGPKGVKLTVNDREPEQFRNLPFSSKSESSEVFSESWNDESDESDVNESVSDQFFSTEIFSLGLSPLPNSAYPVQQ